MNIITSILSIVLNLKIVIAIKEKTTMAEKRENELRKKARWDVKMNLSIAYSLI